MHKKKHKKHKEKDREKSCDEDNEERRKKKHKKKGTTGNVNKELEEFLNDVTTGGANDYESL